MTPLTPPRAAADCRARARARARLCCGSLSPCLSLSLSLCLYSLSLSVSLSLSLCLSVSLVLSGCLWFSLSRARSVFLCVVCLRARSKTREPPGPSWTSNLEDLRQRSQRTLEARHIRASMPQRSARPAAERRCRRTPRARRSFESILHSPISSNEHLGGAPRRKMIALPGKRKLQPRLMAHQQWSWHLRSI